MTGAPPGEPRVIAEGPSFVAVYKPPLIHSAPLRAGEEGTLLDWCAGLYPEVRSPRGRKPGEGGLLHRLDYGTSGIVLLARTAEALEGLNRAQEEGRFIKRYRALSPCTAGEVRSLPGMPPPAPLPARFPASIESAFRPWGPGRREVRPVPVPQAGDRRIYRTVILEMKDSGHYRCFRLEISRGFRHQIRCHLAWLGFPLLGDLLYGGPPGDSPGLALLAEEISFPDPLTGEVRTCAVPLEESLVFAARG